MTASPFLLLITAAAMMMVSQGKLKLYEKEPSGTIVSFVYMFLPSQFTVKEMFDGP